nr:MAG TPA: hypothetical protein [Caudoviricetes sp.]DAZ54127.1 MAG TPA: hypothetical protein [Caudoviricetes sp.]
MRRISPIMSRTAKRPPARFGSEIYVSFCI